MDSDITDTNPASATPDCTNYNTSTYACSGGSESAYKTIADVNAKSFSSDDQILFRKGQTWRAKLTVPSSGTSGHPITFGAFGSGEKPKLLGSIDLSAAGNWTQQSDTWYATAATDVGSLIFNNEGSVGFKKANLGDLTIQGDFFWESSSSRVYVYSTSNPGSYYSHIEAALKPTSGSGIIVISGRDYITIQDLDLRYGGAHGINVSGFSSSTDYITIQRCKFSYIGGSYESGTTRYGNGVQFYSSSSNVIVSYNSFDNIFDSAMTPQAAEANAVIANHDYYYNTIWDTDQSFSIFNSGASSATSNINIYNNVFYNNGGGWSHAQKTGYDSTTGSAFLIFNSLNSNTSNCNFKNNIVHTSTPQHIYIFDSNDITGWTFDYNNYYPDGAAKFKTEVPNNTYTFAQWKTTFSQDANSLVSNPYFVAGGDAKPYPFFYLRSYSPVINAGTNVGLTTDYLGAYVPQGAAPDIGAFEYTVSIPENIWFFFPLFLALPRLIFILQNREDRRYFFSLIKDRRYQAILRELYLPYLGS